MTNKEKDRERRAGRDDYAEQALRNAPAWVLAKVRAERERRGLPPLAMTAAAIRGNVLAPAVITRKKTASTVLVGLAAPFVSKPVQVGNDQRQICERFSPEAWKAIVSEVSNGNGTALTLRGRHNGSAIASVASRTLEVHQDRLFGLWFVARLDSAAAHLYRAVDDKFGCACSVTFSHAKYSTAKNSRGLPLRMITAAKLHDISLVASVGDERAAYEGARCFIAASDSREHVAAALERAKDWATRYGMGRM
jgi:hypothetical protein